MFTIISSFQQQLKLEEEKSPFFPVRSFSFRFFSLRSKIVVDKQQHHFLEFFFVAVRTLQLQISNGFLSLFHYQLQHTISISIFFMLSSARLIRNIRFEWVYCFASHVMYEIWCIFLLFIYSRFIFAT